METMTDVDNSDFHQRVTFPSLKNHNQEASSSSILPTPPISPSAKTSTSPSHPTAYSRPIQGAHVHQQNRYTALVHHLPFRRISLPTSPSAASYSLYRQSMVSVESFDSLPEEDRQGDSEAAGGAPGIASSPSHPNTRRPAGQGQHVKRVRVDSAVSITSVSASPTRGAAKRRKEKEMTPDKMSTVRRKRLNKRRKIVEEFWETEKAYVDGLELIYSHFLSPLVTSLDTSTPILDRNSLTTIFSNFIDIWNLHRSFFSELSTLLQPYGIPAPEPDPSSPVHAPSHLLNVVDLNDPPTSLPLVDIPSLSQLLLSHFPYLSLYKPFITSFPNSLSTLTSISTPPRANRPNPQYNDTFGKWLVEKEQDERCGKLKLRDWLLTIVQRCPRYLLLIKDLVKSLGGSIDDETQRDEQYFPVLVHPDDAKECERLKEVYILVSKITSSLNTNLQTHAQTLALISLQRSTSNLPSNFQFISPGRLLLRRGGLLQQEGNESMLKEREVLLFSDCLIWMVEATMLEDEEKKRRLKKFGGGGALNAWGMSWITGGGVSPLGASSPKSAIPPSVHFRNEDTIISGDAGAIAAGRGTVRQRSKSDAAVPRRSLVVSNTRIRNSVAGAPSSYVPPNNAGDHSRNRTNSNNLANGYRSKDGNEEKWVFKGKLDLLDFDLVVGMNGVRGSNYGNEDADVEMWKFEVLSPEGSFVLFSATEEERDEWVEAIRSAKAQFLISLNNTNPNTTLTSSESTNHIRRSLQALPYPPDDERLLTIRIPSSRSRRGNLHAVGEASDDENPEVDDKAEVLGSPLSPNSNQQPIEGRRRKVDHWVPAIWIPDDKTEACMRCGKKFGWRRRRHHCRLCGRCVCAACSGRTFFIADNTSKEPSKSARACDECYETAFPIIDDQPGPGAEAEGYGSEGRSSSKTVDADTITSLSHFPSWLSMPSLHGQGTAHGGRNGSGDGVDDDYRPQKRAKDLMAIDRVLAGEGTDVPIEARSRLRARPGRGYSHSSSSRPRSTYQILEDFVIHERKKSGSEDDNAVPSPYMQENSQEEDAPTQEEVADVRESPISPRRRSRKFSNSINTLVTPLSPVGVSSSPPPSSYAPSSSSFFPSSFRKEDTVRRMKRLSLPAVSLHTLNVTAHASVSPPAGSRANRAAARGLSSTSVSVATSVPISASPSGSSVASVTSEPQDLGMDAPTDLDDANPFNVMTNTTDTTDMTNIMNTNTTVTNATKPDVLPSPSIGTTMMTPTRAMTSAIVASPTTPAIASNSAASKSSTSIFKTKRFSLAMGSRSQLNLTRPSSVYSTTSPTTSSQQSGGMNASVSIGRSSVDLTTGMPPGPGSGATLSTSASGSKVHAKKSGEKGRVVKAGGPGKSAIGAAGRLLELLGRKKT